MLVLALLASTFAFAVSPALADQQSKVDRNTLVTKTDPQPISHFETKWQVRFPCRADYPLYRFDDWKNTSTTDQAIGVSASEDGPAEQLACPMRRRWSRPSS